VRVTPSTAWMREAASRPSCRLRRDASTLPRDRVDARPEANQPSEAGGRVGVCPGLRRRPPSSESHRWRPLLVPPRSHDPYPGVPSDEPRGRCPRASRPKTLSGRWPRPGSLIVDGLVGCCASATHRRLLLRCCARTCDCAPPEHCCPRMISLVQGGGRSMLDELGKLQTGLPREAPAH